MAKNKQILLFSGLGLAVLGGVTAVLLMTAPEKKKEISAGDEILGITAEQTGDDAAEPEETESLCLSEKTANDVKSVEITNGKGTFTITDSGSKDADGNIEWTINDIASAPLNAELLRTAVTNAAEFDAKEFAEEVTDSSQLAKYGLDAPTATVKAVFTDGTEFSFRVGNDVPNSSSAAYVTTDGKKVYTVYKSRTDSYLGDSLSFVSLKAMPEYDQSGGEEVRRMTIERIDLEEPIIIDAIEPADEDEIQVFSYRLMSPYTAYADLTDSPKFMYSTFGITAAKCEFVGINDDVVELVGLNEPTCTVTVESSVKTYTLTLGKAAVETVIDDEGNEQQKITGFYGTSSEVPGVLYRFDVNSLAAMTITPENIISKLFMMPYIYSLDSLAYSDKEGRSLEIRFETIKAKNEDEEDTHNYYVNGEKYDREQQIKNLYQYIISAQGEELYTDSDKGELLAEFTYNYLVSSNGVNGKDVVRFYSSNTDRKVIIELNGQNVYKTRQMYITQLFKNIESFNSGDEIVLTY